MNMCLENLYESPKGISGNFFIISQKRYHGPKIFIVGSVVSSRGPKYYVRPKDDRKNFPNVPSELP